MAYIISNNKHYTAIAEKIRRILITENKYKPSEIPSAITGIQDVINVYSNIITGVTFGTENVNIIGTKMYPGMFAGASITTLEIPKNITEISNYAFYGSKIKNIILHDSITSIGKYAFANSSVNGKFIIPNLVTNIGEYAFYYAAISYVDANNISIIPNNLFYHCEYLETVILRNESMVCSLGENAFEDTPIAETDTTNILGYIYVPSCLIDEYKSNDSWAVYADRIRAIEDYPDICN